MSGIFHAYCDSIVVSRPRRRLPRWAALASCAVAAAAVLFLAFPRARVERGAPVIPPAAAPSAAIVETAPAPITAVPRRHIAARRRYQQANLPPAEPDIQITIPADAIFPPGAVPEGVNFTADVTIAPDGSARQIRLQPRLTGFERRPQP